MARAASPIAGPGSELLLRGDADEADEACDDAAPAAGFHFRGGSTLRVWRFDSEGPRRGTVVLLHGLLASHRTWAKVCDALQGDGWAVVAPDLLGFGESPWPRGAAAYTVEAHCQRLEADVLSHIAGQVHLVGHSAGAVLAAELLKRHLSEASSPRILTLTTVAMPFFANSAAAVVGCTRASTGWRARAVRLVLERPKLAYVACSLICQQRRLWLSGGCSGCADGGEDALHHSFDSVLATFKNVVADHRLDANAFRGPGLRILALHGELDDVVPRACAAAWASAVGPNARLAVLPGAQHGCAATSQAILAELRPFLNTSRATGGGGILTWV
ncbi:Alpha/Beta hydrolase protein [Pelagophyceae sp. CCMP2097]|nr:Alpha/Beta hydrolase protein [Pelagophyceae sp. CCMP2097]